MLEILLNIITPDIRCHGNYRCFIELADKVACGNSIEIWHNNIHENEVIFRTIADLVHCFESIELDKYVVSNMAINIANR